ncbi:hypothetical protein SAMN05192543_108323 [Paraburkholderia megapolitana]|uniref:Uncharacterized protein n=1 Tax=Paraburkholderia megapolitana TaxID=420953 RepID=A0A1I3SSH8_9BURK|nr:hypothetical protein SAMN05192543_108323 [Paraburkholderia megapolitana]
MKTLWRLIQITVCLLVSVTVLIFLLSLVARVVPHV